MKSDFEKFLSRFVEKYSGIKQIYACVAGGGISISQIGLVPGSSKILYGTNVLYSETATQSYLKRFHQDWELSKMVSYECAERLIAAMSNEIGFVSPSLGHPEVALVAITSAVTTSRYRRGLNEAWICTSRGDAHVSLDKLPESLHSDPVIPWREQKIEVSRRTQDEFIAEVAIKLATGFECESLRDYPNVKLL